MGIVNKNKAKKMVFKGAVLLFWILWILTPTFTEVEAASKLSAKDWLNYIVEIAWAYMDQYFSMVHFNVAWNDFWWWILWLPVEQISGDVVEISIPKDVDEKGDPIYDSRFCSSKVRGFYWNSQRWDNRLWPMDEKTHQWLKDVHTDVEKYAWLNITWWWYTTCSEDRETVELNAFLEANWVSITLSDIANIITELSNYPKEQRATGINAILDSKHINNSVAELKIKNAILSWVSLKIDPYGIYWKITHDYRWEHMDLIAWAHYDVEQNRISTWNLTCSLQRLSNNYPFWYLYDDYWHIWIIWARIDSKYIQWSEKSRAVVTSFHTWLQALLDSWVCMNEIFWFDWKDMNLNAKTKGRTWYQIPWRSDSDAWNTIWKILSNFLTAWNGTARTTVFSLWIKGIVWLTDEVRDNQKEYFENNQLQSTLMLRTETSIANVINVANRNAERLCRGKWNEAWVDWSAPSLLDKVICLSWFSATSNTPTPKQMSWKTIVVRNADFTINMHSDYQSNKDSIDLFIDRGNLLLDTTGINTGDLMSFDDYWYLSNDINSDIKAMFLKGTFIINGLMLGGTTWTGTIDNRLYMHGKLISYNTITVPTTIRKNTIEKIINRQLWTAPEQTSLTKLFSWWCNPVTWEGSDGTSCKWSSAVGKESQLVDKAFWLIDMDLESELIKN